MFIFINIDILNIYSYEKCKIILYMFILIQIIVIYSQFTEIPKCSQTCFSNVQDRPAIPRLELTRCWI